MAAKRRPTIGVLVGFPVYEFSYPNPFASAVIAGIQTAARDQGINILVGCGVNRGIGTGPQMPPYPPENFDFLPIGPWNTDGVLVFTPLFFQKQAREIQELQKKGFPIVFIGSGAGTPVINIDNEDGIRQAVEHLAGHGHRDIAFVAGVEADGDSQSRLKAYRDAVRTLGLNADPRLVEFGQHMVDGGYNVMKRILQSGVKFTAAACSNDNSAVGALRAIREAGLSVPWDVAVTGFDDDFTTLAQVPPLTSVHYPMFETGYRALLLIRKRLEYGPGSIPEETRIRAWLVPRQSCGCIPEMVNAAVIHHETSFDSNRLDPQRFKENLSQVITESLLAETTPSSNLDLRPLCDRLAASFLLSLEDGDLSHFQIALMEVLQRIETMDEDTYPWQSVISILNDGAHALLAHETDAGRKERAENLVNQARTLISESARRRYVRNRFQQIQTDEAMGRLTAQLLSSLDEEQIYLALEDGLPKVGVRSGYVALFEPQGDDPVGGSRMRTYQKDAPPLRFATREFPPAGLYPEGEPFSLALLPLFFQEEKLGYVAFDGSNLYPLVTLVRQIASALKSAELHGKVLELSLTDGLTGVHNRRSFEMFLQKEVERGIRYNRRLSTIMIDIDHFKEYNDSFGHPAGDDALRKVAEDIQNGARRGLDVISRYGGEEFAVILPETEVEGARIVAENIRMSVESDTRFRRKMTISLGIASLSGEQLSHANLIEQADRALYQAKEQGRNRAILYEEWMQESAHVDKPEK
jgi:diguanylate cyclase (GGDEF)-like protein